MMSIQRSCLLLIMAIVLTFLLFGCAFPIKDVTPEFLDPERGHARIWAARDVDNPVCGEPKYEFYYTEKNQPISEMAGYVCVPYKQAQEMIRYYNEDQRKNAKCPNVIDEKQVSDEIQSVLGQ